ncbi:MAG: HlyC/CorC family transporter [Planctomycetes bacterium]|nr:HlyC/CorC family transporter [Planctomycetota bacterium]MBL7042332.1 HlyC/CorC family transporter [Pirellulaceae bacterium]
MTQLMLVGLFAIGLLTTIIASIGAKTLRHFSHRQLEDICHVRKRLDLFGQILDLHDDVALAAEKLQAVGVVVLCFSAVGLWATLEADGLVSEIAAAVGVLILILVITIWIPWAVVRHWSAAFLLKTWRLWWLVYQVLRPLAIGSEIVHWIFWRLAGQPEKMEKEEEEEAFEDEIITMVTAGQREGLLEPDAREMIEGVIELGDADVSDIMTPRSKVDALDVDLDWAEVLRFATETGRTRIPVYERALDNIVGVLYVKDLLPELANGSDQPCKSLRELLREPWLIPSTIPQDDLLQDFLENRKHLAIVVDEYGAVEGVVTIEDVLEEIVGEIVDESDDELEEEITQLDEAKSEVLGVTHLDTINECLAVDLPESDDYYTIAGFLVSRLGHIPKRGESVEHNGVRITVLEAKPRRVERVLLETVDERRRETVQVQR